MNLKIDILSYRNFFLERFLNKLFLIFTKSKIISLPTKNKSFTILKSPHVYKKSREQFSSEICKKKVLITGISCKFLKQFLNRVSCKGVAFKITLQGK